MTTETPPDWVLLEAAKRCNMFTKHIDALRYRHTGDSCFRALCDMIQKHEKPPVDRKMACAREATMEVTGYYPDEIDEKAEKVIVRAIELWEEGFGKFWEQGFGK
jgi:hypothetical protein